MSRLPWPHSSSEVTSRKNAHHDRLSKPAASASAGIPLCFLDDPWAPEGPAATLHGEPRGDVHRPPAVAESGEPRELPAPFAVVIDTGGFPTT